ncbi:NADPH:quinone oxidoreductase family protein [Phenylobacterium sp.]|uniref:NADPH:quinone oxidoreductase family protein n=1 Tax=Phenylobacterium sp. TaxID=1871053 RepID=UPI0025DCF2BC|nr:NADPH:quinone oxidoreductase family protein [Phenylobacterium sp.]MBX3484580.1 NADPH:quinone oxidoreductase family protein [Phenylobacterium sp.]MCW5759524.1 NADPH:quinone oxidoreductase family protein [Phenylobacterium sp.]
MRALVVEELLPDYAGVHIRDVPVPQPGPGEVRIRVRAAAVNFPDLMQTRGEHQHKPPVPFVGGMELAGEIDALGEGVAGFAVGDAVCSGGRGGFAEYAILPAATLRRKPERLSFAEAAGYPVAYLTAYVAFSRCGMVQPGEWVLVHGAAGGVGLAAVDYAKVLGARVIAASASDEKLAVIEKEYDVDATVNVTRGFRERVKALTGGRGADVIYDPVGGDVFDESIRCIAFGGRILSIGFTSGRLPVLPVNIALIKGFSVHGVRAGEYGRQFPARGRENNAAIWKLAEDGRVRPRVDREYPLTGWREAFETLAQRKVVGKTIIRPDL